MDLFAVRVICLPCLSGLRYLRLAALDKVMREQDVANKEESLDRVQARAIGDDASGVDGRIGDDRSRPGSPNGGTGPELSEERHSIEAPIGGEQ